MTVSPSIDPEDPRPADRALAARLRAGDEDAEAELVRALGPRLKATAAYFLGWQDSDIEDVVQQAFMAAFERLDGYDPGRASLYTWMNQICVYLCFKRVRRRKRVVHALAGELELLAPSVAPAQHDGRLAAVRDAVGALEEPCRSLVQGRVYEDQSYAALADRLRLPMGTVASRLARCLKALRGRLTAEA